ncbi:hypothetical protein A5722_32375 [Mycobacterium vulneris]|nr:hypothetical protein A5722_32375 [Mycolicibacterium vulneris]OCB67817.1 hypothetical protein A5729_06735 [Mycolicibacterium vulneris]
MFPDQDIFYPSDHHVTFTISRGDSVPDEVEIVFKVLSNNLRRYRDCVESTSVILSNCFMHNYYARVNYFILEWHLLVSECNKIVWIFL